MLTTEKSACTHSEKEAKRDDYEIRTKMRNILYIYNKCKSAPEIKIATYFGWIVNHYIAMISCRLSLTSLTPDGDNPPCMICPPVSFYSSS
jgi:hypothetical protein